jgi:hypothetical protein
MNKDSIGHGMKRSTGISVSSEGIPISVIRINVDALQGKGEGVRRGRGLDFVEMTMRCV